ncbi:MAG: T9SS type A sorting domain-containing protein [bacterium]|nr:T9SS type A sorting domain-containing protein [bacterium]
MRALIGVISMVVFAALAQAQITLNQNDAPSAGQSAMTHAIGTTTFTGTQGSGNMTWDLSSANFGTSGSTDYVDPTTTPFTDSFPTATHAATIEGASSWSYFRVTSDGLWYLGFGTELGGGITNISDDPALALPFPCTYNTSWTSVFRVTFEPIPGFSSVSVDSSLNTVNAWGNLMTPLWTESALRVLSHGYTAAYLNGNLIGPVQESWDYQFITEDPLRSMLFSNSGATGPEYTEGDLTFTSGGSTSANPVRGPVAESFKLSQNYPNPFNPSTTLPVELSKATHIEITIYNEVGQVVSAQSIDLSAGQHSLPIDGSTWSTGSYFAKVTAGSDAQTTRMVLVK